MQVKNHLLTLVLMTTPVLANEELTLEFLEYLGGFETEVDGEWVNPADLDTETLAIVDTSSDEELNHE